MTPEPETWVTYSDGASRGNPGLASYGAVVIDPSGKVVHEASETLGVTTNNIAEYRGLIAALEGALKLGAKRVEVRMDSELLVRQAIGRYRVKNPGLIPLHKRVLDLSRQFTAIEFKHVRRELNKHADALANQALDRGAS
jgi:ribonuclease H / adenosylcobalamin/alpha-ribazole phosphatase